MRARHLLAGAAAALIVTAPLAILASGVTPPPLPASTPTGDWVPGWDPGAHAPDGIDRPSGSRTTAGPRLPQTGAGAPVGLAVGAVLAVAGGAALVWRWSR